jgi:hypothetical protein
VLGGRVTGDSAPARRDAPKQAEQESKAAPPADAPAPVVDAPAPAGSGNPDVVVDKWITDVVGSLTGMRRAVAQMAKPTTRDGIVVLMVDNQPSAERVRTYLKDLTSAIHKVAGGRCTIEVEVRGDDSRPVRQSAPVPAGVESEGDDEFIDIDEVKSLPTVSTEAVTDQLTAMFPGSQIISEDL